MTTYKPQNHSVHKMPFAIEFLTPNFVFIKINGVRRGHAAKVEKDKWVGQLGGNKSELAIAGSSLDSLRLVGILFKYKECPRHVFWSRLKNGAI